jgi:hypothetical protein
LERMLHAGIPRPAFLFFHYNPQTGSERGTLKDPAVSDRVELAWRNLVRAGFSAQNTIYIMCSDHGFPDPSTGMITEWEIATRLSHDLVLTDDNILIPLYIQYPGCTPQRITTPVSSLDIFPTLLDLLGIPDTEHIKNAIDGKSLVPLIETGDEDAYGRRFFRCDSRLMLQVGRSTAIRGRDYKYIRFHDEYRTSIDQETSQTSEVLVDLVQDPREKRNLLLSQPLPLRVSKALDEYRCEYERSETRAVEFQIDYFLAQHREGIFATRTREKEGRAPKILLMFEPDTAAYVEIGLSAVARAHPLAEIDLLARNHNQSERIVPMANNTFSHVQNEDSKIIAPGFNETNGKSDYDLLMLFVQDPSSPIAANLLKVAKGIKSRRRIVLDCNFNAYRPRRYWYFRLSAFIQRLPYILEEPAYLLCQMRAVIRLVNRHVLNRFGLWYRWESGDRKNREKGPEK